MIRVSNVMMDVVDGSMFEICYEFVLMEDLTEWREYKVDCELIGLVLV